MELREGMLYNRMFSSDSDTFRHLVHCCTDSDKLFIVEWCNIATQMYRVGGPTKDSTVKGQKLRGNHGETSNENIKEVRTKIFYRFVKLYLVEAAL